MSESTFQSVAIRASDGFPVPARLFSPARGPARATVLIAAATGAPQGYYGRFAEWLAARGLRAITWDYRGIGEARPRKLAGFRASLTDWARLDTAAVLAFVERSWPGEPFAMVGHSFGGQLLGLTDGLERASAVLLVASQLAHWRHWDGVGRLKVLAFWHAVIPALTPLFGYLPAWSGLGESIPAGVAREWRRWALDREYFLAFDAGARHRLARLSCPVLAWSFSDDDIAPRRAVDALLERLTGAPLEHRHVTRRELGVPRIGHFGFFRPAFEAVLWEPSLDFLAAAIDGQNKTRGAHVA